jgi:hypothetical protein
MQKSPVIALLKAIRLALASDPVLVASLGGTHIFDEVPRGTPPPYITFTRMLGRDWSTNTGRGVEQWVYVESWSAQPGLQESLELGDHLTRILEDQPLTLEGWNLVSLRVMNTETSRERQGRLARMVLKVRALLEENTEI